MQIALCTFNAQCTPSVDPTTGGVSYERQVDIRIVIDENRSSGWEFSFFVLSEYKVFFWIQRQTDVSLRFSWEKGWIKDCEGWFKEHDL